MQDYRNSLAKLRRDAAEYELITNLATDPNKCEMFTNLSRHLTTLGMKSSAR
jgi:hypothetical protein